jgi:predicted nucleic acid-binding protein
MNIYSGSAFFRKKSCESFLERLIHSPSIHSISICRTIVEEVRVNLTLREFHDFIKLINISTVIDEDFQVPFELGARYEAKGLKPADAFIAAYTEWAGVDALITENRHFLTSQRDLPFKVLTAEKCLHFLS